MPVPPGLTLRVHPRQRPGRQAESDRLEAKEAQEAQKARRTQVPGMVLYCIYTLSLHRGWYATRNRCVLCMPLLLLTPPLLLLTPPPWPRGPILALPSNIPPGRAQGSTPVPAREPILPVHYLS